MRRSVMSIALSGVVGLCGLAHGDAGEWRIAVGGGGTATTARVGGADGTGVGFGIRGRLGHDLSNTVELGVVASYAHTSDLEFYAANFEDQTGTLFANVSEMSVAAELRWTPGLGLARAFERTGPYVAARAGGVLVLRSSQQLFTPTGLLLIEAGDDLKLTAFAGGALGVEHRFGDHFFVAAEVAASVAVDERSFGLTAEAAWAWY